MVSSKINAAKTFSKPIRFGLALEAKILALQGGSTKTVTLDSNNLHLEKD